MVAIDNHNFIGFSRGCRVLTWLSGLGSTALRKGVMIPSKACTKCKQIKPLSAFYKDSRNDNGLQGWCKECHKCNVYSYRKTEKGKQLCRKYAKRYHKRYPEKTRAIHAVNGAIRSGKLPKANTRICGCGNQAEHYHHYNGYAKENHFDVVPLCIVCHTNIHRHSGKLLNWKGWKWESKKLRQSYSGWWL